MARGKASELGPPVPKWLTASETYGFGNVPWRHVRASKWRFVTHTPHSREHLMALRAIGMRGFPYMTFYQTPITRRYQGVRMSEHTDWLAVDRHGQWQRTGFWESEDAKNMYCTCANVKGYREHLLGYLEHLMDLGAGGIFLDNVTRPTRCYGEKFGAHEHLYPTQLEAFTTLLKEAQALIREKDPEGALLINSADPVHLPRQYWPWIDCEMSESYICTWVSTKRWGDWHRDWNGMDRKLARWVRAGKQVCCLSYVGHTRNTLKDDCFFCYASARLMNFIWQAGNAEVYEDPECNILYQVETGQPRTRERVTEQGVHYRIFESGMVAVNPTDRAATLEVRHAWPTSALHDLYANAQLKVKRGSGKTGTVKLRVPRQSGRVYLFEPAVVAKQPARPACELTIETRPALGKARFRVDDVPLWTHSGRWRTEYVTGPNYGKCRIDFDRAGVHRVEALDLEKKALLVASSYVEAYRLEQKDEADAEKLAPGESPRLGKLMDPSNPTGFLEGEGYRFVGWEGAARGKRPVVRVRVKGPTRLVARYEKL